mgnify:CR=1 FL=1
MHDWMSPDPVGLHAQARPEKLALVDLASGRRWTYRAFDAAIEKARVALVALGLTPGDRLATIARNSADLLIAQQAAMRSGVIFTPLNWRLAPAELDAILADCTPALLLSDGAVPGYAAPAGTAMLEVSDFAQRCQAAVPGARGPSRNAGEPAVILYTSGTSGVPKGGR